MDNWLHLSIYGGQSDLDAMLAGPEPTDPEERYRRQTAARLMAAREGVARTEVAVPPEGLFDGNPRVRLETLRAAVQQSCGYLLLALVTRLKDEPDALVRSALLAAVGQFGTADEVPIIASHLQDENSTVREAAVQALVAVHHRDAWPWLCGAVSDPSPEVAQAARRVILRLPIERRGRLLADLLADPDPQRRDQALAWLNDGEPITVELVEHISAGAGGQADVMRYVLNLVALRMEPNEALLQSLGRLRQSWPEPLHADLDVTVALLKERLEESQAETMAALGVDPRDPQLELGRDGLLRAMGQTVMQGTRDEAVRDACQTTIDALTAVEEKLHDLKTQERPQAEGFLGRTLGKAKAGLEHANLDAERKRLLQSIGYTVMDLWKRHELSDPPLMAMCAKVRYVELKNDAQQKAAARTRQELWAKGVSTVKSLVGGTLPELFKKTSRLVQTEKLKIRLMGLTREYEEARRRLGEAVENLAADDLAPDVVARHKVVHRVRASLHMLHMERRRLIKESGVTDDNTVLDKLKGHADSLMALHRNGRQIAEEEAELQEALLSLADACISNSSPALESVPEVRSLISAARTSELRMREAEVRLRRLADEAAQDNLAALLQKQRALEDAAQSVSQEILSRHGRDLTVMFTDIKDFTRKSSEHDLVWMMQMLEQHDALLLPVVKAHGGSVIKKIGDALMVSFSEPVQAVRCGIAIQRALSEHNRKTPREDDNIQVRIGVNCGRVLTKEGDLYGDAVNIASRVEGLADASQIFVTQQVYDFLDPSQFQCVPLGPHHVKGIAWEIPVYEIRY